MDARRKWFLTALVVAIAASAAWAEEADDRGPIIGARVGVPTLSILMGGDGSFLADRGPDADLTFRKPFAPVQAELSFLFPVGTGKFLGPAYKYTGNYRDDVVVRYKGRGAAKGPYAINIHGIGLSSVWASYMKGPSGLTFFASTRVYLNYGLLDFEAKKPGFAKDYQTSGLGASLEPVVMTILYRAPFGLLAGAEVNFGEGSWFHFAGSAVAGDFVWGYLVSPFVWLGWAF
jgi:hypothetical protein